MAGGSMTLLVDKWEKVPPIAQRLMCWVAEANRPNVQVLSTPGGNQFGLRVPEESFGAGAFVLKRGGTNLVAGYVAGSNVLFAIANGDAIAQGAVPACPASTNQPTTTGAPSVVLNVGGIRRQITLNYANIGGGGTVNIYWGDGTSTLGAAESGASNHTYPDVGTWTISVVDASDATQVAVFSIVIP